MPNDIHISALALISKSYSNWFVFICSVLRKKGDSELELAALQACAATLCCGVVFDPSGLNENGYIYSWLNRLLSTHNEMVNGSILSC